jgi:hypothetical protein
VAKRIQSNLIEQFLHHVDRGLIAAKIDSSGPAALHRVCDALRAIQDGDNVDSALGIERTRGGNEKPWKFTLAALIHHWESRGEKWATIEVLAGDWLQSIGEKPLRQTRLRQIRDEKRPDVERAVQIRRLIDTIDTQ